MTTPLSEPLTAAITAVADALTGVDWLITGSVARALSGFAATPRDLDLTAGLTLIGPGGILPPDFDLMWQFSTEATVDGRSVRLAPLEEQIVRILVSGNEARRARFVREAAADYIARNDYVELRLAAARAAR
jgi:hypothetical protein